MSDVISAARKYMKVRALEFPNKSLGEAEKVKSAVEHRDKIYKPLGLCRNAFNAEILGNIGDDVKTVLEIGTGKGGLTLGLSKGGRQVDTVGLDFTESERAYLYLLANGISDTVSFYNYDVAEGIAAEEKSYDLVVSSMSFHHFKYPFRVVREMIRVAKKQLIIADFNARGFEVVREIHKQEGKIHEEERNDFFIMKTFLAEYGFDVELKNYQFQDVYIANRK